MSDEPRAILTGRIVHFGGIEKPCRFCGEPGNIGLAVTVTVMVADQPMTAKGMTPACARCCDRGQDVLQAILDAGPTPGD